MAVKFDLSSISEQLVSKAELSLYHYHDDVDFIQPINNCGNSGLEPVDLLLQPIAENWDVNSIDFGDIDNFKTFSNKKQWPAIKPNPVASYHFDGVSQNKWHTWDVTEMVNSILGGKPNLGFMIWADLPQSFYESGTLLGNWYASSDNTTKGAMYRPKLTLTTESTPTIKHVEKEKSISISIQQRKLIIEGIPEGSAEIKLCNVMGVVFAARKTKSNMEIIPFREDLASGVYLLSITDNQNGSSLYKLILN